jgi:glycosyltransferase involved in cell wall biosynthesis
MVLLEAMASGLPVIATRVGDVDRIVEQGVSGLVIEPLDSAALQRALQTLIGAPERAMHMGAAARERVERNFSSTKMAHEYLTLYEQVLRMTPK